MTVKSVEISEYQCHRNSIFDFVPGMNVITGSSDKGKSASFRAMLWALRNRPQGGAFKCWDAKDTDDVKVSFEFSDDQWFTKSRVKNTNLYEFEGGKLEALRTDIPQQIQDISKIDEYNIQEQHEEYFMLQDSGGERAKMLNKLVGLDIIDRLFKRLNGKVSTAKQEAARKQTEIATLEAEISEMREVLSAEPILSKLTSDIETMTKTVGRADSLRKIIGNIRQYDAQIEQKSAILKAEESYLMLNTRLDDLGAKKEVLTRLNILITSIKHTEQDLADNLVWLKIEEPYLALMQKVNDHKALQVNKTKLQSTLTNIRSAERELADNLQWLQVEEPYQALAYKIRTLTDKKQQWSDLAFMLNSIRTLQAKLTAEEAVRDALTTKYTTTLEKASVCPICKSAITATVRETISNHWR